MSLRPLAACLSLLALSCTACSGDVAQTVTSAGVTIQIPAGAIADPSIIAVNVVAALPQALPANVSLVSDVFEFTPHGTSFSAAVTIEMPFGTSVPAADYASLGIYRYDDVEVVDIWQPIAGATFAAGVATFQTDGFSWYVVGQVTDTGAVRPGDFAPQSATEMEEFCDEYAHIEGDLTLAGALTNSAGLSCLQSVGKNLLVGGAVADLSLPSLQSIGALETDDLEPVVSIVGDLVTTVSLPSLTTIAGPAFLSGAALAAIDMPALTSVQFMDLDPGAATSFDGVAFPAELPEWIQLHGANITSLGSAFTQTTTADGLFFVTLPSLTSLAGLESVTSSDSVSVRGTAVTSLQGLENLESVEFLILAENPSLSDLDWLSSLTTLAQFTVEDCDAVSSLSALGTVTSLTRLTLSGNAGLTDISALQALDSIGELIITDNPSLPQSQIDDLLSAVTVTDTTISGNGG